MIYFSESKRRLKAQKKAEELAKISATVQTETSDTNNEATSLDESNDQEINSNVRFQKNPISHYMYNIIIDRNRWILSLKNSFHDS